MAYNKTTMVDNESVITSALLNGMQDAIIANETGIAGIEQRIAALEPDEDPLSYLDSYAVTQKTWKSNGTGKTYDLSAGKIVDIRVSDGEVSANINVYGYKADNTNDRLGTYTPSDAGSIQSYTLKNDYSYIQLYYNLSGSAMPQYTLEFGVKPDDEGSDVLNEEALTEYVLSRYSFHDFTHRTCAIFKKVVCCGDSYTAGYIKVNDSLHSGTNEDYAWPFFMSVLTGREYVNCGHSGATSKTWRTMDRGLPKATASGVAQAYLVGLMINDVNGSMTVGTTADIGTDSDTYYGNLSKVVTELHTLSPDAHIFLMNTPKGGNWTAYNTAVSDIATSMHDVYHTHLLDLYAYRGLYDAATVSGDYINGHYSAIGYQQFAEILCYIWSEYINQHIGEFQSVAFLSAGAET